MKVEEFTIGGVFFSGPFQWLCTDKGSRTITAIMLDPEKEAYWFVGPPYILNEEVFDEHELNDCYLTQNELILGRSDGFHESVHPGFSSTDMRKMFSSKNDYDYPHSKVLKRDRVGKDGSILHPYTAYLKNQFTGKNQKPVGQAWHVKTFEIFSCVYSEMPIEEFVQLDYSTEDAMKLRKDSLSQLNK